mgnify:CR=1 FL=1
MKKLYTLIALLLPLISCIRNDIPYPIEEAVITSLDVEGAEEITIDKDNRKIVINLKEITDIHKVRISSITCEPSDADVMLDISNAIDLSSPVKVTLHTYQDYVWEITAIQKIERYFKVEGQIGESVIDVANHRVICQVGSSAFLEKLNVTDYKLGPKFITSYSPNPTTIHDFSEAVSILVSYRNTIENWLVYVIQKETSLEFFPVNAWSRSAYFEANGVAGKTAGFRYRKTGQEWVELKAEVNAGNGKFMTQAEGLEPETEYEAIAFCGDEITEPQVFVTDKERQLPNSGFETWSKAESSKYYSFYDPESPIEELRTKWWDNGNNGSTTIGAKYAITIPDTSDKTEGESSVKLASAYVVIKFAAGNIFSGQYYKTLGTSGGVIRLGRPFEFRPRMLSLKLKYKSGIITKETYDGKPDNDPVKVGDKDRGIVWVSLGDWDYTKYGGSPECPVEVNTSDRKTFFNRDSEAVIAYGEYVLSDSTDGWINVEIPLEYKTLTRKPTHIIVSCAASMLGDYFTGSADSILWLDDMKLKY